MEKGANVNAVNHEGNTPLMFICALSPFRKQIFEMLISENADNKASRTENLYHQIAIKHGSIEGSIVFESIGPEMSSRLIDAKEMNGNTPLMLAAKRKDLVLEEFFMGYEADLSKKNNQGKSADNLHEENSEVSYIPIRRIG